MRYYIEIPNQQDNGKLAAELITDEPLSEKELMEGVMEFAQEQGVCPSFALDNCRYKVE